MTDVPQTIEAQLSELKSQYQHAANICQNLRNMYEDTKRQKLDLEMRLAAKSELIRTLEARIEHLSGNEQPCGSEACQCGKGD